MRSRELVNMANDRDYRLPGIATCSFFDEETDLNIIDILRSKFPKVCQCLKWLVFALARRCLHFAPTVAKVGEFPITRPRNNTVLVSRVLFILYIRLLSLLLSAR